MNTLKVGLIALYRVYAAVAFAVIVLLLFCPALIAAPTLSIRRMIGRVAVKAWLAAIGVRLVVRGLDNVPTAPCVVVCNHASYVDGIVLTAALPMRFTFLVQHGAASWPYVGLIIRRMGVVFVDRSAPRRAAAAVRCLLRAAKCGVGVAMFPEGTFRRAPGLQAFYSGAFFVAAWADCPVVPGVMHGTRLLFGDEQWLPRWSRIEIDFLKPFEPMGTSRAQIAELCKLVRTTMVVHHEEGCATKADHHSADLARDQ